MKPFLKIDEATALHLARPELATGMFAAIDANRAYLRRWLPWVDGTLRVDDTLAFMKESMQHNANGTRLTLILTHKNIVAGSIGVVSFNRDHAKCEVGYWLVAHLQGLGIMTKAYAALLDFLFRKKAMNRVESHVFVGNERSRALLLRLGFKHEGTLSESMLQYGEFHDVEIFGMLKSDWQQLRSS